MKLQVELTLKIDTEKGTLNFSHGPIRCLYIDPAVKQDLLGEAFIATDLLGRIVEAPKGRTPIDQDVTRLIDFFKDHSDRPSVYVPKWDRDKKLLLPYLKAKGFNRIGEMMTAFIQRMTYNWDAHANFNAQCVLGAPLTIPGFVQIADRLEELLEWESEEAPYK